MQLTRQTDYAIRVLVFLGMQDKERLVTITAIADHFQVSRNHLMKIVHKLGQLNYIHTVRGKNGGLRLQRLPHAINLGQVVRDFETSLEIVDCHKLDCPLLADCRFKPMLIEARDAFLAVMDNYTLTDLLIDPRQIRALLQWETEDDTQALEIL